MLSNTFTDQNCSVARALETVGERWTLLVLREAFLGTTRFEEFALILGSIPRHTLSARLTTLVKHGVLERRAYQEAPRRYEYVLTKKGTELHAAVHALMAWGDRWASPDGPPVRLVHTLCGREAIAEHRCAHCHEIITHATVRAESGPGATSRTVHRFGNARA
jgi:DNA-binding HxlR family transcriptional regulator